MATIHGHGGEEWQTFEQAAGGYDPSSWQSELVRAKSRIEDLRQRDVEITLVDRTGKPLSKRRVDIVQQRSAFSWGWGGWSLVAQLEDGSFNQITNQHQHRQLAQLFNTLNIMHYWAETHCDNAPQSEEYQGHVSYEAVDAAIDWARGRNIRAKGHPLYWPVAKALPDWLRKYDYETRMKFLEVRVRQITARFAGRMEFYDAVNEMLWEPTMAHTEDRHWPHIEPIEAIAKEAAKVLQWAREEDPEATYLLNEYGIARGDTVDIPVPTNLGTQLNRDQQMDRFIALGRALIEQGQAPDALGLQTLPGDWNDLFRLGANYDAIGEGTGLPVFMTEARTNLKHFEQAGIPAQEQIERLAEYAVAAATISYGNPHVEGFHFWSGWNWFDGRKPTAVYRAVDALLNDAWMTKETVTTDAHGTLRFRGFTGDYALRLTSAAGQTCGTRFSLPQEYPAGLRTTIQCNTPV